MTSWRIAPARTIVRVALTLGRDPGRVWRLTSQGRTRRVCPQANPPSRATGTDALLVVLAVCLLIAAPIQGAAAPSSHALLIGVQDYTGSNLRSLEGPVNDVTLVRELLESRFQVPKGNIVTLVDAQATHGRIKEAFARLVARVKPGDLVYIQYSGHGSYTDDKNGDERSGKDQTWVSYGARSGRLAGEDDYDVIDDELLEWMIPLWEKTDQVVFVSDSCHSASVSRGELLGVRAAIEDPRPNPIAGKPLRKWDRGDAPGVRIGAARDTESAVELSRAGKAYGLFTWFWVESLNAARPGETWDQVFTRASTLVTTQRGAFQRPQLEGERNRTVFGGQFLAPQQGVPVVRVDPASGLVEVQVGAVNGATVGSVYHLQRPGGSPAASAPASLELTRVGPYVSQGRLRDGSVQVGDLVVEVEHAYPFEPLRLAVEGDYAQGEDRTLVDRLVGMVKGLEGFAIVEGRSQADWVIYVLRPRRSGDRYVYGAKATLPESEPALAPEAWVITPQEELLNERMRVPLQDADAGIALLEGNLRKLARVQEVKRLAARSGPPPIAVTVSQLRPSDRCERDCVRLPDERGMEQAYAPVASHPLEALAGVPVRRGDVATFSVKNAGDREYYVYLLDIGPDGTISAIFPHPRQMKEHARIEPGKTRDLSEETALLLNALGRETLKVIASAEPIDVRLFEMEGYAAYKGTRGSGLSPLERLLAEAMGTRGAVVSLREADWGTLQVELQVTE